MLQDAKEEHAKEQHDDGHPVEEKVLRKPMRWFTNEKKQEVEKEKLKSMHPDDLTDDQILQRLAGERREAHLRITHKVVPRETKKAKAKSKRASGIVELSQLIAQVFIGCALICAVLLCGFCCVQVLCAVCCMVCSAAVCV